MSMTEFLEKDREKLLSSLMEGKTPAETVQLVTGELDRVLLSYVSEETDRELCRTASHMIGALKGLVPAIDSIGDTKLWERTAEQKKEKKAADPLFLILFFLSLLLLFASVFLLFRTEASVLLPEDYQKYRTAVYALPLLAGLLCFFTGLRLGRRKKPVSPGKEQKLELFTDGEKLYRILHAAMLVADRELETAAAEKAADSPQTSSAGLTDEEATLYLSILEAGYNTDDESLRECAENLRYFLHRKGIETEDYSEEHADWFSTMPGRSPATIRPALSQNGELWHRGLAIV